MEEINKIIAMFSGEERIKLQKHFVSQYGSTAIAKEKAISFAAGFGKACDLMIKELEKLQKQ